MLNPPNIGLTGPENPFPVLETWLENQNYPDMLKQIYKPPKLLYYRGTLEIPQNLASLAIVGTRKMSSYGRQSLEFIMSGLQGLPIRIISGLAYGTDACAHQLALNYGLNTWAVLGSGIDDYSIYPRHNRHLAQKILESGGALISEFPIGTKPLKAHFPQRNRIIAGLSQTVLVTEAGKGSGALITATFATEEGRDVFALPGSIFSPTSIGTNCLIASGAHVAASAYDIIKSFSQLPMPQVPANLREVRNGHTSTAIQIKILDVLAKNSASAESVAWQLKTSIAAITAELVLMEIAGHIKKTANNYYVQPGNFA